MANAEIFLGRSDKSDNGNRLGHARGGEIYRYFFSLVIDEEPVICAESSTRKPKEYYISKAEEASVSMNERGIKNGVEYNGRRIRVNDKERLDCQELPEEIIKTFRIELLSRLT